MRYVYALVIDGAEPAAVTRVMGRASSRATGSWARELHEEADDTSVPFAEIFLEELGGKFEELRTIGVGRSDITIWLLYEYEGQCNLEFSPAELARIGNAGLSFCISCWETIPS